MTNLQQKPIYKICTAAVLIALSTVLSLIKVFEMPLGGSITLLSMVPVCLISIMYGPVFAIAPCMIYGAIRMLLGNPFSWGLTPATLIGCIAFDYIIAFGVLCTAGLFRKKGFKGIVWGIILACALRFGSHFISGVVFFANLEQFKLFGNTFVNHPVLYSVCYNGFYMLPETVLTVLCSIPLFKTKAIKRFLLGEKQ